MRIAVTCGDAAGVGPEVALAAVMAEPPGPEEALLLVGPRAAWDAAAALLHVRPAWTLLDDPPGAGGEAGGLQPGIYLLDTGGLPPDRIFCGRCDAVTGRASFEAVARASALALAGRVDALVTAPIDKAAWAAAGRPWLGHTGYLAYAAGAGAPGGGALPVVMSFLAGPLRVGLATTHLPLAEVSSAITVEGLAETLSVFDAGLRELLSMPEPRIAVCGLNPHAGERGRLGREDDAIVAPAIARARAAGIRAEGPFPADSLFARVAGEDAPRRAVLALYHDQGLIPAKLLAFGGAVNLTMGLPFPRTSPDHGTAVDRAGAGTADPTSMLEALRTARRLGAGRRQAAGA